MTTVLLPWNLGSYAALNGFHPLLKEWVDVQSRVDFIRPRWQYELTPESLEELAAPLPKVEGGLSPIFKYAEARAFYSQGEFALLSEMSAQIEFHHTVPFTSAKRPFIFHCERVPPVFMPFLKEGETPGRKVKEVLPIYRRLFESDNCLAIYSHLHRTLDEFDATFGSKIVSDKLRFLPLSTRMKQLPPRPEEGAPVFLFTNSAQQRPITLLVRGLMVALNILDLTRQVTPGARLIIAGKGARELLEGIAAGAEKTLRGLRGAADLVRRNLEAIVFVEDWLTEASMDRLFQSADFFLLPSLHLHSASLLRAMKNGCIPITSNFYGSDELLEHGKTGIVIEVLDRHLLKKTGYGFTVADEARFLERHGELLQAWGRAIQPWLRVICSPPVRAGLRRTMGERFQAAYVHDGLFQEFHALFDRLGTHPEPSGDRTSLTQALDPEADFGPIGRSDILDLAGMKVARLGRGFVSIPPEGDRPNLISYEPLIGGGRNPLRYFATAAEAISDAIAFGPESFNLDLLPGLITKAFVRRDQMYELTLFADGVLPATPPDCPFRPTAVRVMARNFLPHRQKASYSVAVRVGDRFGDFVAAPMVEWQSALTLRVPEGEGAVELVVRPKKAGLVQLASIAALSPDGDVANCDYGGLPGIRSRDFLLIPADAEPGHAIYGPYVPLTRGAYFVQWRGFAAGEGPADQLVLTLEILTGEEVVVCRDILRADLDLALEENFEVKSGPDGLPFQFRLSHHGAADVVLLSARLFQTYRS